MGTQFVVWFAVEGVTKRLGIAINGEEAVNAATAEVRAEGILERARVHRSTLRFDHEFTLLPDRESWPPFVIQSYEMLPEATQQMATTAGLRWTGGPL